MKKLVILLVLSGATAAFAQQQKSIPLSDVEVSKIEAANLKLQNLQLQFQLVQTQLQKLQEQYPALQQEVNNLVESAKKAHNLGNDATLSTDGKMLLVTEKSPSAPEKK